MSVRPPDKSRGRVDGDQADEVNLANVDKVVSNSMLDQCLTLIKFSHKLNREANGDSSEALERPPDQANYRIAFNLATG